MKYLSSETAFYIVMKAREFDVKVEPENPEHESDAIDDGCVEILEDFANDPTAQELEAALRGLNEDQLHELVALTWIGRGSFSEDEWHQAFSEARDADPNGETTPSYLMGTPLLSDFLESGLDAMGVSIAEYEKGHL